MNIEDTIKIFEFERAIFRIGEISKYDNIKIDQKPIEDYLSDLLGFDYQEMYNSKEIQCNCKILNKELKKCGFAWWHLGDALYEPIVELCISDKEINEESIIDCRNKILYLWDHYKYLVATELPPPIPKTFVEAIQEIFRS